MFSGPSALAASMPSNKLTPKLVQELYPEQVPADVEKLIVNSKGLQKIVRLSACSSLKRLDVSNNSLTSLEGLHESRTLKWVSAANNQVTSLRDVEGLTQLQVLNLSHNKLNGVVTITELPALRALILNDNQIESVQGLRELPDLNTVILKSNLITELQGIFRGCTRLEKLSMAHNEITELGDELADCSSLAELRVGHNELEGLPQELSSNTRLRMLDAGANRMSSENAVMVLYELSWLHHLSAAGLQQLQHLLEHLHVTSLCCRAACRRVAWLLLLAAQNRPAPVSARAIPAGSCRAAAASTIDWVSEFERCSGVQVLKQLPLLRQLTLQGNPVTQQPGYPHQLLTTLPQLAILDTKKVKMLLDVASNISSGKAAEGLPGSGAKLKAGIAEEGEAHAHSAPKAKKRKRAEQGPSRDSGGEHPATVAAEQAKSLIPGRQQPSAAGGERQGKRKGKQHALDAGSGAPGGMSRKAGAAAKAGPAETDMPSNSAGREPGPSSATEASRRAKAKSEQQPEAVSELPKPAKAKHKRKDAGSKEKASAAMRQSLTSHPGNPPGVQPSKPNRRQAGNGGSDKTLQQGKSVDSGTSGLLRVTAVKAPAKRKKHKPGVSTQPAGLAAAQLLKQGLLEVDIGAGTGSTWS